MLYKYLAFDNIMNDCLDFAKKSGESNDPMYALRGQNNNFKTMMDRYYGKIAEWAVYYHLISLNLNPSEPDMSIYDVKEKNFNADIYTTNKSFHVKSCQEKENPSWVFQKNSDPLVFSPKENDIIVLTTHNNSFPVIIKVLKYINGIDTVDYYDDLYSDNLTEKGKCSLYWYGRIIKKNKGISKLKNVIE